MWIRWVVASGFASVLAASPVAAQVDPPPVVPLGAVELKAEAAGNVALRSYLARNGLPDRAVRRSLAESWPWDDHEIVLDYLDRATEVAFARARVLDGLDGGQLRRSRTLPREEVDRLRHAGRPLWRIASGDPLTRAEEAAASAESIADHLEAIARRAEHAAARAERATEAR